LFHGLGVGGWLNGFNGDVTVGRMRNARMKDHLARGQQSMKYEEWSLWEPSGMDVDLQVFVCGFGRI
jgi:hypothetical protein